MHLYTQWTEAWAGEQCQSRGQQETDLPVEGRNQPPPDLGWLHGQCVSEVDTMKCLLKEKKYTQGNWNGDGVDSQTLTLDC